jgi:hypothetical protein
MLLFSEIVRRELNFLIEFAPSISLRSCCTAMLAGLRTLIQTRHGPDRYVPLTFFGSMGEHSQPSGGQPHPRSGRSH